MLELYLILDLSFTILWFFRYLLESSIILTMADEAEDRDTHTPFWYLLQMTLKCLILFPLHIPAIFIGDRWKVIEWLAQASYRHEK
jgi:hypothetical protein